MTGRLAQTEKERKKKEIKNITKILFDDTKKKNNMYIHVKEVSGGERKSEEKLLSHNYLKLNQIYLTNKKK